MEKLIDSRNKNLWEAIQSKYDTRIEKSINDEYSCYVSGDTITFYIPESNYCKDSFTHELLHIYLRMNECFIGAGLTNTLSGSNILRKIFSPQLLEHIGNCLDHTKMLPIYLTMGFDNSKFILDFHEHKCSSTELSLIKKNYRIGKSLNPVAVDAFIGRQISILADPNTSFDYSQQLNALKKIDPLLFSIVIKMVDHWKTVDVSDYHSVLSEFYKNLLLWVNKNK